MNFQSSKALISLSEDRCSAVFSAIGRLSPERFVFVQPPNKRKAIAAAALKCVVSITPVYWILHKHLAFWIVTWFFSFVQDANDKLKLTAADIESVGFLINYFPTKAIASLQPLAFVSALPYLQGISYTSAQSNQLTAFPCFSNEMRDVIRSKIIEVFG